MPINKVLIAFAACVLSGMFTLAAHGQQILRGQICLGPAGPVTDLSASQVKCNVPRAKRGQHFLFVNSQDKAVYQIDGRKSPKPFAGRTVIVIGTLDKRAGTIEINDIYQALAQKAMQAKTIYIDCDNCLRGMGAAWRAAFDALTDWGRFEIAPDPMNADLILLISANPYLGDYVTRDGPDQRVVRVDITYMNVVDPKTGASLWGDWKQWGSMLVAKATKDLINEFREELKLEESVGKT